MPYPLIFTEEFFMGAATLEPPVKDKPKSIFEALEVMPEDEWEEMCNHLFPKVHYEMIDIEDVMDLIKATDTCSNLDSPVLYEVYERLPINLWSEFFIRTSHFWQEHYHEIPNDPQRQKEHYRKLREHQLSVLNRMLDRIELDHAANRNFGQVKFGEPLMEGDS
jgi:hypothetical protein